MKEKLKIFIIVFISILVFFIGAEIICRIIFPRAKEFSKQDRLRPDPEFIKSLQKENKMIFDFRGKWDIKENKKNHEKRILFLGDSFLFSGYVCFDELITTKVEKYLNLSSRGGTIYKVFNAGIPSSNTESEFLLLQLLFDKVKPDLIIVCYCLNDAEYNYTLNQDIAIDIKKDPAIFRNQDIVSDSIVNRITNYLNFHSRLFAFLKSRFNFLKLKWKKAFRYNDFHLSLYSDKNKLGLEKLEAAFSDFGNFSKKHDIPVVFAVYPLFTNLDENYPYFKIHNLVRGQCFKNNLYYYDMLPLYWKRKPYSLWIDITDSHPNTLANDIAALGVYCYISQQNFLNN